jgi:hypothetical protein
MDDPVDLRKRSKVEKMTQQEFLQHANNLRDTAASINCQKNIDRIFLVSAMQLYADAATNIRLLSAIAVQNAQNMPEESVSQSLQSARKVLEGARRNWIRTVTKIKDGVATAESYANFAIPGMDSEEATKYRKLIKEKKPKADSGGSSEYGASRKRSNFRGRGRGGGNYYRNDDRGGYDHYYGGDGYGRGRGGYDNRRPYNAGHGGYRGGGHGGRNYQDGRGHGQGGGRDGYRDYNTGGAGGNVVPHTQNNG